MFPISDDNPTQRTPVITMAIIAICTIVYLFQLGMNDAETSEFVLRYGFVPAFAFGRILLSGETLPGAETVLTSMFLHGSILHIAGNMLFLWIFGDNIEDAMGRVRFVIFYLLCGGAAAMAQALPDLSSTVPMIGASGAISGVMAAYLRLYPNVPVRVVFWLGFFAISRHLPAMAVIGLWFVLQLINAALSLGLESEVAFWAHVGGFVAGLILTPILLPAAFDARR